jgi:hypothetical protein
MAQVAAAAPAAQEPMAPMVRRAQPEAQAAQERPAASRAAASLAQAVVAVVRGLANRLQEVMVAQVVVVMDEAT